MNTINKLLFILLVVTGTVAGSGKTPAKKGSVAGGTKKSTESCLKEKDYSKNIATLDRMAKNILVASKEKIPSDDTLSKLQLALRREDGVINIVKCMTGIGNEAREWLVRQLTNIDIDIEDLSKKKTLKARTALIPDIRAKADEYAKALAKIHRFKIYLSDSTTARALKNGVEKIRDAWDKALSNWEPE